MANAKTNPTPTNYIRTLPPDFEYTPEEQSLLDLYGTVKLYEKEAARLREAAAKAKLQAADERYQRERGDAPADDGVGGSAAAATSTSKRRKKKRKKKQKQLAVGDTGAGADDAPSDGEASDASGDYSSEEESADEGGVTLSERREAKLQQMRNELEEKKKRKAIEEGEAAEALRLQHLEEANSAISLMPSVKRKKREEGGDKPAMSLIANLQGQATPTHEFSKDLNMGNKENSSGTVVFPTSTDVASWTPPDTASNPADGALEIQLPDFESLRLQEGSSNNTIAIKFSAPQESKRFSINIAAPGHRDYYDIPFHFNPRPRQKGGQLVINDKSEGIWGSALEVPLSTLPLMFGDHACTLIIQINGDGFDIFLDGEHCARLEHRTQLPKEKCSLTLQFPSTDDYGSPEVWTVYRVWWGQKPSMASGDISGVPGVNMYSSLHPKKLFVSGLSKLHSLPEVELRRAELERAFRKYGGSHGVAVVCPMNATYAFVEVEAERQADLALQEMASKYRLNRARRTKHEALQEERAAAEAANEGKLQESSEWD
mmetsp:Transcript_25583/g.73985  ORF Transcript_25583/g.73985 Transcript_25583/m.73985 type:complete len:545 (-) Transcript_25583:31-1665(-)